MTHKWMFTCLLVLGCGGRSIHAESVTLPHGQQAIVVDCKGLADCYNKSATLCPGGYELVGSEQSGADSKATATAGPGLFGSNTVVASGTGSSRATHEFVIQCTGGMSETVDPDSEVVYTDSSRPEDESNEPSTSKPPSQSWWE